MIVFAVAIAFMGTVTAAATEAPTLHPILKQLCDLFVLHHLMRESSSLLLLQAVNGRFVSVQQCEWLRECVDDLCDRLRESAVPLVDAFHYSDHVLNSCIGRRDGDVYQSILRRAQQQLNSNSNSSCNDTVNGKPNYHEQHIKPLLSGEKLAVALGSRSRRRRGKGNGDDADDDNDG